MSAAPVQRIGVHHRGCLEVYLQHVGDLLRESRIGYDHRDLEVEAKGPPYRIASRTAEVMAEMLEYHILDLDKTVSETVAPHMPTPEQVST
jgi:hypothetical protein